MVDQVTHDALTRRLLELQLASLQQVIDHSDLESAFAPLIGLARDIVPGGIASVMVLDRAQQQLRFAFRPDAPERLLDQLDGITPGIAAGSCGTAAFTAAPVLVEDTQDDPRWIPMRGLAEEYSLRACWSMPVLDTKTNEVLGTFAISRLEPGLPNPEQKAFLEYCTALTRLLLTREREAERLTRKEMLLEWILEQSDDLVFIKDSDRRFQMANRAETHGRGITPEGLVGRRDEDFYKGEALAAMVETDLDVLRSGRNVAYVQEVPNPTLGPRLYHVRKSPLFDADGEINGLIGIARDLTDMRRFEEERQRSGRLQSLGLLAGGIAHDFNNLLTAIGGNIELAQLESTAPSAQDALRDARLAAKRAEEFVTSLLSSLEHSVPKGTKVDLAALVQEVVDLTRSMLPAGSSLRLELEPELEPLWGDAAPLRQLTMNLLLNAYEALSESSSGGVRIQLRCARQETGQQCFDLVIADDGCGMDAETRRRLFDPFFSTKSGGHGLGMSIVRAVVAAHSGALSVDSEPGQGTTVRVSLPMQEQDPDGAPPAAPRAQRLRGAHVLIVEDEPNLRKLSERALQLAGVHTSSVESAEHALAMFETNCNVDALVVDLGLPGSSGGELLEVVRHRYPELPVLLVSGNSHAAETLLWQDDHHAAFLMKPYRPSQLHSELEKLLAGAGSAPG